MPGEQFSISSETQRRIDLLFAPALRDEVVALLAAECGRNLALSSNASEAAIERIQFAALKQSGGDMGHLMRAIELAQADWRDLLVAAGFAVDVHAHERWLPHAPETPGQ
ncbi:MAG TPA: hypothetical protein VFS30_05995 [Dehalococcoidia bacterium]|nr:hypothetical protein [Dehalococcoidia bacterium]